MSAPISQLPLTLKIILSADWHVGEGAGQPGYIDRLVRRHPEDELPYLPAKTLTGIWRDVCESVAEGLDRHATGPATWSQWVNVLFGDQPALPYNRSDDRRDYDQPIKEARLSIRAARLPEKLRQHLKAKRTLEQAITFIKPGVKIDPDTGQALDDHLRFEELVRGGAELTAPVSLDTSGCIAEQVRAAQALLWAGAKVVERLGGKRRRGLGRCRFDLGVDPKQAETFLQLLQSPAPAIPSAPIPQQPDKAGIPSATLPTTTDWVNMPLTIKLRTPVIIPDRTVGNVVQSLDFVPGTYLLGQVTRVLTRLLGRGLLAEVARGDLRLTNAYPEVEGHRSLPVPLALFYEKDRGGLDKEDGQVCNRLTDLADEDQVTQLKQHRDGYVGKLDGRHLPPFRTVALQQTTHNTVQDEVQRPTEAVGGVYTYEAIKANAVLRAELRLRKVLADELSAREPDWWQRVAGEVRLGIAKKDDYGLAELKVDAPSTSQPQAVASDSTLTVWLLSDLLLRDERLRLSASIDLLKEYLGRRLGVSLKVRQAAATAAPDSPKYSAGRQSPKQPLSGLVRTRRTDGWHVPWGLPRPSYIGLMAGSCIVFEVDGSLMEDTLRQVEQEGLGERRAEGFGEVAFNHSLVTSKLVGRRSRERQDDHCNGKSPDLIPKSDPSYGYAHTIESAAWRETIGRTTASLGPDADWRRSRLDWDWQKKVSHNSQLGSLRAAVASLRSASDRSRALDWLENLKATPNRREKWPGNSLQVLREMLTSPEMIWRWLRERVGTEAFPTMTEDGQQVLESELWAVAVRSLLFACIRGEVRDRESQD
jgi:CRISPR-associated protein Csx10